MGQTGFRDILSEILQKIQHGNQHIIHRVQGYSDKRTFTYSSFRFTGIVQGKGNISSHDTVTCLTTTTEKVPTSDLYLSCVRLCKKKKLKV